MCSPDGLCKPSGCCSCTDPSAPCCCDWSDNLLDYDEALDIAQKTDLLSSNSMWYSLAAICTMVLFICYKIWNTNVNKEYQPLIDGRSPYYSTV